MKAAELMVVDDLFLVKLPSNAGEELAEVLMSRYEKSSTVLTRPVPKSICQKRLTVTRAVSGFSALTSQRANPSRLLGQSSDMVGKTDGTPRSTLSVGES